MTKQLTERQVRGINGVGGNTNYDDGYECDCGKQIYIGDGADEMDDEDCGCGND